MSIGSWFIFSLMLWLIGFLRTKMSSRGDQILLSPPFWFTILCGRPKVNGLPKGVLHAAGVWLQLTGLVMLIYGFLAAKFYNNPIGTMAVLIGSLLTSRILTSILVKNYRHRNL